ncbi:MAG TPA: amidohydrolase family protein [Bacteroidales bacterium]|nr:amidohydrolase family protein [Bacteroidales bacterium]HOH83993.1 amidohydrolase family protein [Bacteroidales bacterium]
MSILLSNATYIDFQTLEFIPCNILIDNRHSQSIVFTEKEENSTDIKIDCTGKYVTRAFGCGHHHVYSALATGMPAPAKNPSNFLEILQYVWWTLDKCLDQEMIEISALFTAIECAKNGVTFVVDHHSSPNAIKGSLETIAKAFDKVGVSHLLCYEISDRDGEKAREEALEETDTYLANRQGLVGLHASFTVSDYTLKRAKTLTDKFKTGIHIHVAEDRLDEQLCFEQQHRRVVERLNDFGLLSSSKTILSHCLYIDQNERELIKKAGVWIAQNTESNMNNKVGFFNSEGIQQNVMLGTDGMNSDMLQSAKTTFFAGQNFDKTDYADAYRRFRNVNFYFSENGFSGDAENNLVVLDYVPHTDFHRENFLGHFLFQINSKHVQHVISNGRLIVKDRKVVTVNEQDIMLQSRELSKKLWEKMVKLGK